MLCLCARQSILKAGLRKSTFGAFFMVILNGNDHAKTVAQEKYFNICIIHDT